MVKDTVTANSSREWLDRHELKVERYLRRNHRREDWETVYRLINYDYPDEGRKLVQYFDRSDSEKIDMFLDWIIQQQVIVCGIFADPRQGKDAAICYLLDEAIRRSKMRGLRVPRVVTLGNMKNPPFVDEKDMYYSFMNIPSGGDDQDIYIYSSEFETQIPCREGKSQENQLYSQLSGTFAQNHQKLFACSKLASKLDINFIRDMNTKIFKFISQDKLLVENVERDNLLSRLGNWLLPKNKENKAETLLVFNNNLFKVDLPLPRWYNDEYSEMFRDIPLTKIKEYIDINISNGMKPQSVIISVAQKFRKKLTMEDLYSMGCLQK